jgi:hypothetical protein
MGKSNQEQIEIANTRGITALDPSTPDPDKKKKDVPAWALPMMSAGFAMMASKSPYFMQALGEAGQKGLETYTGIEEAKLTKRKTEAEAAQAEAMAEYYGGGKGKGTPIVIGGKYYYKDQTPFMIEGPEGEQIHARATMTRATAHEMLMKQTTGLAMEYQQLVGKAEKTQQDINRINEILANTMAIANEHDLIASSQIPSDEKKGGWIKEGGKWIWKEAKELLGINKGGIVSLRR